MARTIRKINERTRQWLLAPDINHATGKTYEVSKGWGRQTARLLRGQDGCHFSDKASSARIDQHGGFKIESWTTTSSKAHGDVSRKRRIAGKRAIIVGIEDHFDALEDHGKEFDWRGYDQGEVYDEDSYQQYLDDLAREEEYERREMELDRQYTKEMDNYFDSLDHDWYY